MPLAITPFMEQTNIFNTFNSQLNIYTAPNTTTMAFGISTLWCPSDAAIVGLNYYYSPAACGTFDCSPMTTYYSSYAGNLGTWTYYPPYTDAAFLQKLNAMNGLFSYIGYPSYINPIDGHANPGSIGPVKLSSITDGTSNTISFGERAHGMFSQTAASDGYVDFYCYNWWFSPNYGDTLFSTYYPINPWKKLQNTTVNGNQGDAYVLAASSFHPGGATSRSLMARSGSSRIRSAPGRSTARPGCQPTSRPTATACSWSRPAPKASTRHSRPATAAR